MRKVVKFAVLNTKQNKFAHKSNYRKSNWIFNNGWNFSTSTSTVGLIYSDNTYMITTMRKHALDKLRQSSAFQISPNKFKVEVIKLEEHERRELEGCEEALDPFMGERGGLLWWLLRN